jgi:hypothetical protein
MCFNNFLSFGRVWVLHKKRWWIPEDAKKSTRLASILPVILELSEGVLRFVSGRSHGIWSVFIPIYVLLHQWWLLISCAGPLRPLLRWLSLCLLQQPLLWQALLSSNEGKARMSSHIRLVRVLVITTMWSSELFVVLITLGIPRTHVELYEWLVYFSQKSW